MSSIEVTNDLAKLYIKGTKRYSAYAETKDIMHHLKFHFDGYRMSDPMSNDFTTIDRENPYFARLIDATRPNESDDIKRYRRIIYTGKTKAPISKVMNSLKKIVKSNDWNISYDKVDNAASITEAENLYNYCEQNYPFFKSIENWAVSIGLREMLSDPNALVVVLPKDYSFDKTDYVKPYSYVIKSSNVLDYIEGDYAVVKSEKTKQIGKELRSVPVYQIITDTEIYESWMINLKGEYTTELVYTHNLNELPCFRFGGLYKCIKDNSRIYLSHLDAMLDDLDKAAREVSDLDAEVVQHIYSTMWYYAGQECRDCSGVGKVNKEGSQVVCPKCNGEGRMAKSPYKDMVINPQSLNQHQMPTPPAGYIQKNIEIVKIQDERIRQHVYDALSAINMEFLATQPIQQSGVAKAYDRDELNNFVYGIAYHLVEGVLKPIYRLIAKYRYSGIESNIEKMLPEIECPESFDMLTTSMISDEITKARNAKISSYIIDEMECEFAEKNFGEDNETVLKMRLQKKLDPLPGMTASEKNDVFMTGGVSKLDFILSTYLQNFIEEAEETVPDFLSMGFVQQKVVILKMATEKMASMTAATSVLTDGNGNIA